MRKYLCLCDYCGAEIELEKNKAYYSSYGTEVVCIRIETSRPLKFNDPKHKGTAAYPGTAGVKREYELCLICATKVLDPLQIEMLPLPEYVAPDISNRTDHYPGETVEI